ncbi:hypothetical protein [Pasteurella multocida]|uniref:hypothetical protein n=1 Tax=Pasteurella multocida TaxID=747 RepID=UPI0029300EC0|nr:hypothetical protein [Pasteurella multocida]WNY75947.1 hypothetical protein H2513_08695 [Pasteurella multocida]
MEAFNTVYVISSKSSGALLSVQGVIAWTTKYSAIEAFKKDCKRCGESFETESKRYDFVEMKLSELTSRTVEDNDE